MYVHVAMIYTDYPSYCWACHHVVCGLANRYK